jgi:small conductance mechanosensitive channel
MPTPEQLLDTSAFQKILFEQGLPLALSILSAIVVLLVGRLVAKGLVAGLSRVLERSKTDPILIRFLCNILYGLLLTLVTLVALDRVGINTTTFAAVIAAAGLAIGLALQGSLSNFASGVMLILFRHIRIGDLVEAGGQKGLVEELQIFWTVLRAEDGTKIICPNSGITSGVIKVLVPAATVAPVQKTGTA